MSKNVFQSAIINLLIVPCLCLDKCVFLARPSGVGSDKLSLRDTKVSHSVSMKELARQNTLQKRINKWTVISNEVTRGTNISLRSARWHQTMLETKEANGSVCCATKAYTREMI